MMQLGFVSAILPDCDFRTVMTTAADLGYQTVEMMCWPPGKAERRYAGVTHIDVLNLGEPQHREIRDVIEQTGVTISSLGYYPNPLSADADESRIAFDHIRRVIDAAASLDIGRMTTFIGRDPKTSIEANFERFETLWPPVIRHAADAGVRIGIENCPMLFTADEWPGGKNLATSPAIWRRMFQVIDDPHFGLNYDPSHLSYMQMDPVEPLKEFRDRLHHVHAKDVRVDRSDLNDVGILAYPLLYHRPKLPGLGDVPWGRFFATLGDVGYDGPVCVEIEDRVYETDLESRLAALRQCHTFLRNFIPALA